MLALWLVMWSSCVMAFERNWALYPLVVQIDTDQTQTVVYAVGDAHGDPDRLAAALVAAGVMPAVPASFDQSRWSAGKAILVVTGDMIDKWHNSLGVITLLRTLQRAATTAGGRVVVILGNHEAEFLANPNDKKTQEFAQELRKAGLDPTEVGACKGEIGQFLCNLPAAARINDWFFSHAGNTAGRSIAQIENDIRIGLKENGFGTDQLVGSNSILEARLNNKGPAKLAWFMGGNTQSKPDESLLQNVKALGVNHLVQGHQNGNVKFPDGVKRKAFDFFQRYGLLFLIDSGMSRGIDDSDSLGGVLKIEADKAELWCAGGDPPKTMWPIMSAEDHTSYHCGVPK